MPSAVSGQGPLSRPPQCPSTAAHPCPGCCPWAVSGQRGKLSLDSGTAREGTRCKTSPVPSETSADREGGAHPWQRYLPKNTSSCQRWGSLGGRWAAPDAGHRSWPPLLLLGSVPSAVPARSEPGSSPRHSAGEGQGPSRWAAPYPPQGKMGEEEKIQSSPASSRSKGKGERVRDGSARGERGSGTRLGTAAAGAARAPADTPGAIPASAFSRLPCQ